MTLWLHRAERADTLADELARLLHTPPTDPFAEDLIAVPARGVERWLGQRLSRTVGAADGRADGVCTRIRFLSPSALIGEALQHPDPNPWEPDALAWPLLSVLDECVGQAWLSSVDTHLGRASDPADETRLGRRYSVARRLAGLFDSYLSHRPDMVRGWSAGEDTDGYGRPVPADLAWQCELWRRTAGRIDGPDPADRLDLKIRQLLDDPAALPLPQRVSLFGPTRLPVAQLQLLAALAHAREVHLWLPHPSAALWQQLAGRLTLDAGPAPRRRDADRDLPGHPLLASLGRDTRELQQLLVGVTAVGGQQDLYHPGPARPATLLGRLQTGLALDHVAGPAERSPVDPTDRSVQVHACHGPARQVDVLREVVVGLLAADPTLEPRDVLVMCPDVDTYAPLVQAAFGMADVVPNGHPSHRLRIGVADRALRRTNPLLATVDRLLDLADGRVTASDVLDLAGRPPVRRRFGLDEEALGTLAGWISESGIRWGLDADHREPFGLARFRHGTWQAGLDRILLGAAMTDTGDNWLGLALPLGGVESDQVALAGRLADLLDRLNDCLGRFAGAADLDGWLTAIADAVAELTALDATHDWQQAEFDRALAEIRAEAGHSVGIPLRLADVRSLLRRRFAGRPTRANFRSGGLTLCTMVPMRSVPHRVVCLLGLDDGLFPRAGYRDGDDLLARNPAVGERDARGEDRQLLLDAIGAATDHLVITYSGADPRTGAQRPPAVPVGEILDALTELGPVGVAVRDQVLVRHPLQPFDARNVTPGMLGTPGPFSFDPAVLAAAEAAAADHRSTPVFLAGPLPTSADHDLELDRLVEFARAPMSAFLHHRLGLELATETVEPSDRIPVELSPLEQWQIGDRLLRNRIRGLDVDNCRQAEWRRGGLPPGPLGTAAMDLILLQVEALVEAWQQAVGDQAAASSIDTGVAVPGGLLRGTVAGLHGNRLVSVGYRRLSAQHRITAWIQLLALAASHPDQEWTAVTLGRGHGLRAFRSSVTSVDPAQARQWLAEYVDLYHRGMREPLPLAANTSGAYARAVGRYTAEEALRQAEVEWVGGENPGEREQDAHVRVLGRAAPFAVLRSAARPSDERWSGESTRFGELAMRLWAPLLAHEQEALL